MVSPLPYSLSSIPRINWTESQEKSIVNDFIFDQDSISDDQFVVQTYLQFLWLPQSIMPLKLLVPSLLRVSSFEATGPHPLYAHIKPLLLTARSASKKYKVELPQILANGGGAGEVEEMMMWYALSYERVDDELWTRTSALSEGPWEDEQWRLKWLERMEKREFQIQILLYFLEISLPGPQPLPPRNMKKKRTKPKNQLNNDERPSAERLEVFFDKLSMWQLMDGLEKATQPPDLSKKDTLDWMQTFYEEIVKPQFEQQLPELCTLMYSKIFPQSSSLSASNTSPSTSRASSPDSVASRMTDDPFKRHHRPSPAPSTSSNLNLPTRSRSRSLSVSLAQERIQRERSITLTTIGGSKKRVLNREVSMSRAFKPKARAIPRDDSFKDVKKAAEEAQQTKQQQARDEGVLLVEATPTKPKPLPSRSRSSAMVSADGITGSLIRSRSHVENFSIRPLQPSSLLGHVMRRTKGDEGDDDDEWHLASSASPDILLLGSESHVIDDTGGDDDGFFASPTPVKRTRKR